MLEGDRLRTRCSAGGSRPVWWRGERFRGSRFVLQLLYTARLRGLCNDHSVLHHLTALSAHVTSVRLLHTTQIDCVKSSGCVKNFWAAETE